MERLLAVHVVIIPQTVDAGIFPSYQTAWRWMNRCLKKESGWKPRHVGGVTLNRTGASTKLYCNGWSPLSEEHRKKMEKWDAYCNGWNPSQQILRHEVLLTDELLPYLDCEILRGPKVDKELRPDATVFTNSPLHTEPTGELHYEMDNGTEHMEQIRERMEIVGQYVDPVVWVFQHPDRMREVMRFSTPNSYFKLYGDGEFFNSTGQVVFQQP